MYIYIYTHTHTEYLDAYMGLASAYTRSENGWEQPIAPSASSLQEDHIKGCPTCRRPVTKVRRYGRIINRCMLQHMTRTYTANGLRNVQKIREYLVRTAAALQTDARDAKPKQGPVSLWNKIAQRAISGAARELAGIGNWQQQPVANLSGVFVHVLIVCVCTTSRGCSKLWKRMSCMLACTFVICVCASASVCVCVCVCVRLCVHVCVCVCVCVFMKGYRQGYDLDCACAVIWDSALCFEV